MTDLELAAVEYRQSREAWEADGSPCTGTTNDRMHAAHTLLCAEALAFVPTTDETGRGRGCVGCDGTGYCPECSPAKETEG